VDAEDPSDVVVTRQRGIHSVMALPLKARGRTIGVLRLESRRPAHFHREQMQLMEVAAERMALAIDNARLLQEARERAAHEALIHRIASAVGSSLDLNQVMNTTVKELVSATGVSQCAVALAPAGDGITWSLWEADAGGGLARSSGPVPWWNETLIRLRMSSRKPLAIEDVLAAPLPEAVREMARGSGVRSALSVPMFQGDELVGSLELFQRDRCRRWKRGEIELAQAIAAQLAVAVQNARLYGETDERLRTRVRAVEEGIRALDSDLCALTTVDWERRLLQVRAVCDRDGKGELGPGTELRLADYPHSARALAGRVPTVLTLGHPAISPAESALLEKLGTATAIVVPLVVGDRAIGTAFNGRRRDEPGFSEEEIALAVAMAGQVAVAMENARLFQEVQAQKSRTEALLASMSEGVLAVDADQRVTSVNPWLEAMVGRREGEMVGKRCKDLLRHSDEQGGLLCDTACPLREAMEKGKPTEPTLVFTQTAWGDRIPTLVSAAPIRNDELEVIGAVSVSRDVSREWQMDKLKSNIISVVSHEFRTPLTSIIGFSELLMTRDQPAEERRSCAEFIYNEGLKLEALVNDFLDVSRLDAGGVVLNPEPLAPAVVVDRCVAEARPRAAGHRLSAEVEEGLPPVEADLERLAQVLDNLLSNAVKYSPAGTEIVVRARLGHQSRDGGIRIGGKQGKPWVVFSVEDHGYGIPDDQLAEIFTPFHRVHGELTRRIRGTGLGLSIVKSLVELHGGKVWVESRVGMGSRFHVALPGFLAAADTEL